MRNNETCPSQLESGLAICLIKVVEGRGWRDLAGGSVYLCVISVLLCSILSSPLVAAARLAVSCRLQVGVRPFSAQLWGRCEEAYSQSQG